jgi:3-hydroxyanthranilate 3,4-dioxygenase
MSTKFHFLHRIEEIKPLLKPPVSNNMLFNDALKVMIVGGPNQRKDFHIQRGEELFYQIVGDMNLIIVNPKTGCQEPVHIREGEVFLLPAGVPHSPQRYENTIGLVFERDRSPSEMDCLRWHTDADPGATPFASPTSAANSRSKAEILYEEYFHCIDLGTEIKAAILRFQSFLKLSPEERMKQKPDFSHLPIQGLLDVMIEAKNHDIVPPFPLVSYLSQHTSSKDLAIFNSEFILRQYRFFSSSDNTESISSDESCNSFILESSWKEAFLWQFTGNSTITIDTEEQHELTAGEALFLSDNLINSKVTIRSPSVNDITLFVAIKFPEMKN